MVSKHGDSIQDECDVLTTSTSNSETTTASCSSESFFPSSASSTYEQPWPPQVVEAPDWPHGLDVVQQGPTSFRILHWGPMIAIFIIGFISAITTHYIMMWWPLTTPGGLFHFSIFMLWNYLTLANMLNASFIGAGYVPLQWKNSDEKNMKHLQYCKPCGGFKAPRSHHCSKCKRCVMKMDHHCPWINNCVGHRNHGYFVRFLLFAIVGCLHAITIHGICAYHLIHQDLSDEHYGIYVQNSKLYQNLGLPRWLSKHQMMHPNINVWYLRFGNGSEPLIAITFWSLLALVAASAFAFGVTIGLAGLLFFQLKGIWKNKTGIEEYIDQKAKSRREDDDETDSRRWFYPYDLGWKRNVKEVLLYSWSGQTKGNGIWWPVAEPCDQFTLTREQLAQKEAKRRMARLVKINENFAGGVFGSCSFGCKVFFCQPISEEARVKVNPGERWVITQATKYWFYGHKHEEENPQKGWFPRRVAELLKESPYQ